MIATDQGRMELGAWIEAYGRAWETGDDDLMASLFTEDANYRSAPFREPFRGHDAMWGMSEAGEWVMRGPDEISEWWIRHPSSSRLAQPVVSAITLEDPSRERLARGEVSTTKL